MRLIWIILTAITFLAAQGQELMDEISKAAAVEAIAQNYDDWEACEIKGKLRADGLPVSPGIKLTMVKDVSIMISVRAPIYGEVARIECDTTGVLLVNKMKKKYFRSDLGPVVKRFPMGIGDLQDLILGRVFLLDNGTLIKEDSDAVDVYVRGGEEDVWSIVPKEQPRESGLSYGFDTDMAGNLVTTLLRIGDSINIFFDYYPDNKGMDIAVTAEFPAKSLTVELDLETPREVTRPYEPVILNDKYEQVGFREFMEKIF